MTFFTEIKTRLEMVRWYDLPAIEIGAIAFILLVAKYWPTILKIEWYWLVAICITAYISPIISMTKSCNRKTKK